MAIAVLLNRMFRMEHNPLFEYIYQQKEDIDACYFIIPEEDMSSASDLKAQFIAVLCSAFTNRCTQKSLHLMLCLMTISFHFVKRTISLK